MSEGHPVFKGEDAAECEDFIQNIRRYAFSQGKLKDNEWMALFASTCLSGKALRWHKKLDKETKENWDLLETALLEKWSTGDSDPDNPSFSGADSIIPCAASIVTLPAAPPPSFAHIDDEIRPLSRNSQSSRTRQGRVQVLATMDLSRPSWINPMMPVASTSVGSSYPYVGASLPPIGRYLSFSKFLADKKTHFLTTHWYAARPNVSVGSTDYGRIKAATPPINPFYINIWEVGLDNKVFAVVDQCRLAIVSHATPALRARTNSPMTNISGLSIYADRDSYIKEFAEPVNEFLLNLVFEDV
ncbi:hypothetical protein FRB99_001199 [Tulasnella sp. 403]|nr:hypothetical protein FRB99_001199 [Tulasnella sp. 403]